LEGLSSYPLQSHGDHGLVQRKGRRYG
jgi:hypothetical protein